ncbi:MAG: phytanoyl-CoA dioxygenase family protein [Jatrophihabitans sp.]
MTMLSTLSSNGHLLDTGATEFGELADSSHLLGDVTGLRSQMDQAGYLLLRRILQPDTVLAAREEILFKFAVVGEIDSINHPLMDGVLSDESYLRLVNAVAFTESLRRGIGYSAVVAAPRLLDFFGSFLGGPARSFDFRWPRFMRLGDATGIHCDGPYITRGTRNVWSAWIPLGDVALSNGPIMVLEESHLSDAFRDDYLDRDADRDNLGWLSDDPCALRRQLGGRWLSADFEAGDVLVFGPDLVHASLDNNSAQRRCRLSSDTRYQLASDPLDERYNGADSSNPHGGAPRVFLPGRTGSDNANFEDEWKPVDERGRLLPATG